MGPKVKPAQQFQKKVETNETKADSKAETDA